MSHLHAAARGGSSSAMQEFLANQQGVEVNCVEDEKGLAALHWASHLGHLECVRVLLADPRVDVNFKSQEGRTALHAAADGGHDEVVQLLLTSDKVDVNSKDVIGATPMTYAMLQNHHGIMQLLLADARLADENPLNGGCALGRTAAAVIVKGAAGAAGGFSGAGEGGAGGAAGESLDPKKSCWFCHTPDRDHAVELSVCKGCKKVRKLFLHSCFHHQWKGVIDHKNELDFFCFPLYIWDTLRRTTVVRRARMRTGQSMRPTVGTGGGSRRGSRRERRSQRRRMVEKGTALRMVEKGMVQRTVEMQRRKMGWGRLGAVKLT